MAKNNEDSPIRDVLEDIVELTDEDGNIVPFELLDVVDFEEREFAVLFPCEEPDSSEVLIMELKDDPKNPAYEYYLPVEDEELMNKVYARFKEVNKDNFDFTD